MADQAFDPDKYLAQKSQLVARQTGRESGTVMEQVPDASGGFDPDKYLAEKTDNRGMLQKGLDYGLRALDYPGGLIRTGLASVAGQLSGKTNAVDDKDVANAAVGKSPSSADYLERLGVSEGPSAELPFVGKTSLRDAEGLALDIATDPMTAVAKGVKALRGGSALAEKAGTSIYRSGLKKVDERLAEKGAGSVADLLLSEGKAGTTKHLAKDAEEIGKKALADRQALYEKASKSGAKVDMANALEGASEQIAKMKTDPGLRPMAERLEELVNSYKKAGAVDLATASEWKSNLYNALPETAYDAHGKVKGPAAKVQKALANDFKNAIVDAGNKAEAGLGDQINSLNERLQTTITAKRPLAMQVRRATTTNAISPIDAMLTTAGSMHSPGAGMGLLAAKKAADLSKTTAARTMVGKGLVDLSKTGAIDELIRRGLINLNSEDERGLVRRQKGLVPQTLSQGYEQ